MRRKIKKAMYYGGWLVSFSFSMIFYLIVSFPLRFKKKYKNLWLLAERPEEARDNAYWLYKWILKNRPEINVRFVLSSDSVDYNKMPEKELIVEPGSAKHYINYILSSYSVSTHMHGACPGKSFCIPFLPLARKKINVFLQHGVTKNLINLRGGLDAIISASKKEKDLLVKANPQYRNRVFVTGFCRYDNLVDTSDVEAEKIILVMPTFRRWLRDIGRLKNADMVFTKTDYYQRWNSFLNSRRLAELLENNNVRLIFFPHSEMQTLASNLKCNNRRIIIGKKGQYDVQDLLKRSSILITDYSSVLFDFAYMKKPEIFYQFDQEDFFNKHYTSSGEKYPFGKIVFTEEDLIKSLASVLEAGCEIDKKIRDEIDGFFEFRDGSNCERNLNTILGIKK